MEFRANEGKSVTIEVNGKTYARHAIQTHFVQVGESYVELVEKYVKPVWQPGDLLSSSEKIIGLCQKRVVYKKDMKVGWLARFLSRFASHSSAGIGVDSPYKMQFAINERGALFVIWAAICAGFGKLFGKRGVFYEMVGQEVSGLDGFYDHEFQEYGEFGIRIPENPGKVCDEIEAATGVQAMIVDANDLNVEILGKASSITGQPGGPVPGADPLYPHPRGEGGGRDRLTSAALHHEDSIKKSESALHFRSFLLQ